MKTAINKIQNMDCTGCMQSMITCHKCIRRIMDFWEVKDFYTTEKQKGVFYPEDYIKEEK